MDENCIKINESDDSMETVRPCEMTEKQRNTIVRWIRFLGYEMLKAVLRKMFVRSASAAAVFLLVACGCSTNAKIYATKNWEGHFYSEEEFRSSTQDMHLQRGESVWVLSNRSLERVLKNLNN